MIIKSNRFGVIDVKDDRITNFKDGLLGFPEMKHFILVDDPADLTLPFKWLMSVETPDLAFLVTDPGIFFKDYVFDLSEEDRNKIDAKTEDDVSVITLLTVPADPKKITANLRGPLVINWRTLVGRQVILKDTDYTTKHYIFIQESDEAKATGSTTGTTDAAGMGATAQALAAKAAATSTAATMKASAN